MASTIDTTIWATDAAAIIADMPADGQWNGRSYTGSISDVVKGHTLEIDGIRPDYDVAWLVATADFTAGFPNVNDRVVIGGKEYTVQRIATPPDDTHRMIYLVGALNA